MPNFLTRPLTDKPRKLADMIAEEIDNQKSTGDRGLVKPFMAGAVQGLGDVVSDFTSPLGIASIAAGPVSGMVKGARGLGAIGRLAGEAGELSNPMSRVGRNLAESEKIFNVVDDAGRVLTNPGGYAGPIVKGKEMTRGTVEAVEKLNQMKTAVKTKIKPPRNPKKSGGFDY